MTLATFAIPFGLARRLRPVHEALARHRAAVAMRDMRAHRHPCEAPSFTRDLARKARDRELAHVPPVARAYVPPPPHGSEPGHEWSVLCCGAKGA